MFILPTFNLSLRLSLSVVILLRSDMASSLSFSTRLRTAWAASEVLGDFGDLTNSRRTLCSSSLLYKKLL